MSEAPTHIDFRSNVQHVPASMPPSVQKATAKFLGTRQAVVDILGSEQWEALRQAGHDLRLHTLQHLEPYLARLEEQVTAAGGQVHWARDAAEACRIVLQIAQEHQAKKVVKSKSMATEEINLNHALEQAGLEVLETDLGEYIIQLAGQTPSHIIVPAVHLTKEQIAQLFRDKLGVEVSAEPTQLTELARAKLREAFLAADLGISGANFMVAETGTIVIVSNEGNARMCTTLPPVHIAVAGIDKVVPDMESLTVLLKLLARNATGQKISTYTSFITGPAHQPGENGPQEFHLVLLDNGRTRILADEAARQTLLCIRCGACLNICPVYNNVGGHAYGWVYSGPIGQIFSTQILDTPAAGDLPFASSLCGACADICPVKIPIPQILLYLRRRVVEGGVGAPPAVPWRIRLAARLGASALGVPWVYRSGSRLLSALQKPLEKDGWIAKLPAPASRWTDVRPFPAFDNDFRLWWKDHEAGQRAAGQPAAKQSDAAKPGKEAS